MKKIYNAPETLVLQVNAESVMQSISIDNTGLGGEDGEQKPAIDGNPDEVGAKENFWGVDLWED